MTEKINKKSRKRQHENNDELIDLKIEKKKKIENENLNEDEKQEYKKILLFNNEVNKPVQHVIKLLNVPYGFFEKEMNGYFRFHF
jgi:hypothetical protein